MIFLRTTILGPSNPIRMYVNFFWSLDPDKKMVLSLRIAKLSFVQSGLLFMLDQKRYIGTSTTSQISTA